LAGDIETSSGVDVLNVDHKIATLSEGAEFDAEVIVTAGSGYVPAELGKEEDMPIGWIPVDAIFSPIERVNVKVEQARVGQRTDYDRLIMEIFTDGSVSPEDALAFAAKILKDQVQVFINFEEKEEGGADAEDDREVAYNTNLDRKVSELELSVRAANCLKAVNIKYLGDLVKKTDAEMLKTKNFGRKSLNEIKDVLTKLDLHLGMNVSGWTPPETVSDEEEA